VSGRNWPPSECRSRTTGNSLDCICEDWCGTGRRPRRSGEKRLAFFIEAVLGGDPDREARGDCKRRWAIGHSVTEFKIELRRITYKTESWGKGLGNYLVAVRTLHSSHDTFVQAIDTAMAIEEKEGDSNAGV
jgi:hypothetical protein